MQLALKKLSLFGFRNTLGLRTGECYSLFDDGSGGLLHNVLLCTLMCVCFFCMFCSVVDDDDDIEYILKQSWLY